MIWLLLSKKETSRKLKLDELKEFFVQHNEKPFRAQQVYEWLWKKSAKDFDQMTNLSLPVRELMKSHFTINHILVDTMQRSSDGTIKNAVKLHDGLIVESVLIPTDDQNHGLCFFAGWLQPRLQVLRNCTL
jgi:23S rRNA (adenine2503-C2)-methyltransferase